MHPRRRGRGVVAHCKMKSSAEWKPRDKKIRYRKGLIRRYYVPFCVIVNANDG